MGLKGDARNLATLANALRTVPITVAEQVSRETAPPITTFTRASFSQHESVQGTPWKKSPDGETPSLVQSGAVSRQMGFTAVGTQMRAVLGPKNYKGVEYAKFLIGRYEILPNKSLPADWVRTISDNADRAFAAYAARIKGGAKP